jgi:hypothetical protein
MISRTMTNMQNLHQIRPNSEIATGTLPARFVVGRDGHGGWVVQDRLGLVGGLFASEAAALHFAAEESNHNSADVCRAPEDVVLRLDGLTAAPANLH